MLSFYFGLFLIFIGGVILGLTLASFKVDSLQEKLKDLKEKFRVRKYLYIVKEESYFSDFEKGEIVELIRDCRDGEGYFKKENRRGYIEFENVELFQNSIKKL